MAPNISGMEELTQELDALEARSLRRRLRVVDEVLPGGKVRLAGQTLLNLSSNDYLGLAQDPRLIHAAQAAAAAVGRGGRGLPPGGGPPEATRRGGSPPRRV